MARRFEGLSDLEWKLFEDVFPETPKKRGRGMPPVPFRYVLNSLLYILITGCRWCDLPQGKIWASKSAKSRCAGSPRCPKGIPAHGSAVASSRGTRPTHCFTASIRLLSKKCSASLVETMERRRNI